MTVTTKQAKAALGFVANALLNMEDTKGIVARFININKLNKAMSVAIKATSRQTIENNLFAVLDALIGLETCGHDMEEFIPTNAFNACFSIAKNMNVERYKKDIEVYF